MLILNSTDVLQVVTGSASTVHVHADWADNNSGAVAPSNTNTAAITTATTTTVVASPSSGQQRSVRMLLISNVDAANATQITVQHNNGSITLTLVSLNLLPGETLCLVAGQPFHYDKFGGIYQGSPQSSVLFNGSSTSQGAGFASDTYLTGSNILLPTSRPKQFTRYLLNFEVEKTGAGTATPVFSLRYGTGASTSDTAICTFTFAAGTAAADKAYVTVDGYFRSVGSGTSAVFVGTVSIDTNLTTTGFSNAVKNVNAVSSGFDSTTANTYLGLSVNGGTSAAWTVNQVFAKLENF